MSCEGRSLDEILHEVDIPENLLAKPYLRPVYDDPAFIIRNVWRQFGGWYDGQPDQLLPAPRASLAHEIVTLSGGLDRVLDRVRALSKEEEWTMACPATALYVSSSSRFRPTVAQNSHHSLRTVVT